MGQVRNDCLAAVARVVPDQIVKHARHGAEIEDGPGLVQIEMRGAVGHAYAQYPARLGTGLGCRKLELRAVKFGRYRCSLGPVRRQPPGGRRHGGSAAFEKIAAGPSRLPKMDVTHENFSSL